MSASINKRIQYLRKEILHMSQKDFAHAIGKIQTTVSAFEQDGKKVTDSNIKAIYREFNVNEDWLLYGKGDVFVSSDQFDLDTFVKQHDGTDLEIKIMKAYFELDKDTRQALFDHFKNHLAGEEL